ncbi:ALK1 like protein [Aspergillus parasiticus SU-1]|uniref:non-specific serine/threonine protein kinase n=1 Tax=Aspergillus parasiticus (strain ATCC 56775 / NRRL 5862 / SRRC 143 / SU-1) TaxID=1403190 RepID=A0A0F0ICE3_ASPPU|nr:ALK1 like protein [Aspergillus parasiticus SU-1]
MASTFSPAFTGDRTPKPRTKTRTAAPKRVYGKRRADAPRAVFEQRSPAKPVEETTSRVIEEAVDSIQAQLAEVKISEATPSLKVEDKTDEQIIPVEQTDLTQTEPPAHTPEVVSIELQNDQEPTEESPPDSVPKPRKKYETMLEVRICSRTAAPKPQDEQDKQEQHEDQKEPQEDKRSAESERQGERRPRRNKVPPRLSSGCVMDDKVNAYVRRILNEALSPVAAQGVQKFGSWAARAGNLLEVVKIAEGSYGEVYKLRLREELCKKEMSRSKLARLKAYGDNVFKVVPLRAQSGPGSKKFTSIDEIVSEVKMLKYLDPIPGFARFREIHVVQGRFPESFQNAWDHYKKTKDDCLNPNPSSKRAYPDSQLWAIVEMDDAGCELEKFAWSSTFQIYDIFWGVAMALARAEEYAQFEHRDLHLGNVCIRSTRPDGCMNPPTDLEVMSQSYSSGFGMSTLETTIIDYSLSRAELRVEESGEVVEVASSDLDKKQIFDAIGRDEDEAMLRDTYRYMRSQLYNGNPLETEKTPDIPGIWAEYAPRTNLVWLLFLLKSLLKNRKPEVSLPAPRQPLAPCSSNKGLKRQTNKSTKTDKVNTVKTAEDTLKQVSQLKNTLEDRLRAVLDLLNLEHGHEDMCCAADLVAYAIDSQWLDEKDFF